jgi:hypothetical protein
MLDWQPGAGPWPRKPEPTPAERQKKLALAKDIWRLEWRNREFADRFCESVVDLIRSAHPGALDGGAGP